MVQRSEQLRREAENTRAQLADTLEELRARITPGQVVDQLVDYAGDSGAAEFFRNLGRQAVRNPFPVTLMGAGLAWLMLSGRAGAPRSSTLGARKAADGTRRTLDNWSSAARQTARELKDRASGLVSDSAGRIQETADSIKEQSRAMASGMAEGARGLGPAGSEGAGEATAGGLADTASNAYRSTADQMGQAYSGAADTAAATYGAVSDAAGSAYRSVSDRATAAYETMGEKAAAAYEDARTAASNAAAAARQRGQSMTRSAADLTSDLMAFCSEQPLVLGGLGLALGAVLGAALPTTRAEDELMGETSDRLKERAQTLAGEQVAKAKAVADHALQETRDEVERQGLAGGQAAPEHVPTAPALPEEPARPETDQTVETLHEGP